ncbi:hypothetical protein [Oceaniglobus trochenteri]|uniref:hypothetical protein n=1 Tax=Oceaniglobus trochenteri TaxID=2763260 RepID=UPI001CFFC82A|nr:hypothetical protein [Oceaniglobus trochenteri]
MSVNISMHSATAMNAMSFPTASGMKAGTMTIYDADGAYISIYSENGAALIAAADAFNAAIAAAAADAEQ